MDDETHASTDLERNDARFLMNQSVKDFSWSGLTVTVKDRETKQARDRICDISGNVKQGTCDAGSGLTVSKLLMRYDDRGTHGLNGTIGMWNDNLEKN
ncbi:unnamed protein product [Penicillium nalgiovense]|nr:unnamed protein product [Penicillium nalgiovense]CAG7973118.1 unnamed protein product [Penicillium nalgiovense]CAG8242684.1 unnamed protein product [Penicillium nalgiovense]CAG8892291.1 unnamed protein product [Penicillium nalgiovense]CAH0463589.1 unnamed protein product [Penicillium nalgiovense]